MMQRWNMAKRLLWLLMAAVVLGACVNDEGALLTEADAASDAVVADGGEGAVADDSAVRSESMPEGSSNGPGGDPDYDWFGWDDEACDAYVMTYTQKCGQTYRVDEPMTVWVEGGYFVSQVGEYRPDVEAVSIPLLHERIVAMGDDEELVLVDIGALEEPAQIIIEDASGQTTFCFELLDFAPSSRDGDGRMFVPLTDVAQAKDRESTSFGVPVASCNGNPTFEVFENPDTITVIAESWIPEGDGRNDCLDGVSVSLEAPIGDRQIVDGFSRRTVALLTEADLQW